MNNPFIADQTYKGINYSLSPLPKGDYENCIFDSCSFSKSDMANISFMECEFTDCDLSNAHLKNTTFKETSFIGCKLLGLCFDHCSDFLLSFGFQDCSLNLSSFYKLKLKNTKFQNCSMISVDFTETDLTQALFESCNLENALFQNSILEKTDFRTAFNYTINMEKNSLKKAKFSKDGVLGLLMKYDLHIE